MGLVLFPTPFSFAQEVSKQVMATDSIAVSAPPKKNDLKHTVNYFAKDSIWFDVQHQIVQLHGGVDEDGKPGAHIDYGNMKIDAAYIEIDWLKDLVTARGIQDSTGAWIGQPIFEDDGQVYELETIGYNTKTQRALIKGAFTKQENDYIYTYDTLAKDEFDNVYIQNGYYCPCENPQASTYIRANKIKVIPGERVVTGPFNLWVSDVATPLFLPFGMFPISEKRTSGFIFPQFTESQRRGFAIQNGGYYLPINDYVSVKTLFDFYTKGGWSGEVHTNYIKRYRYSGNMQIRYSKFVTNADEIANRDESEDFWIDWQHHPKSRGGKSFSASVNAGTNNYNSLNSFNTNNYLGVNFRSNISYRTPIGNNSPFNLVVNLRQNQNVATEQITFDLPDMSLNMNRINPFKTTTPKRSVWGKAAESFNFSYSMNIKNQVNSHPVLNNYGDFEVANLNDYDLDTLEYDDFGKMLRRSRFGIKHNIPISMTANFGSISVSPFINYTDLWYTKQLDYDYDQTLYADTDSQEVYVNVYERNGFSRVGYYRTGVNLTTRLYGFYGFKGRKQPQIRQTVSPSLTYTYTPDFSDPDNFKGWERVQIGENEYENYSKYQGFIYGGSSSGESQSVSFALNTILDMKHNAFRDTSKTVKKYKLIENLGVSSGYNFAAERFNLSNFNFNLRTKILKFLSVNSNMTVDPYVFVKDTTEASGQTQMNVLAWNAPSSWETNAGGIGAISAYRVALSANLSPKTFKREHKKKDEEELSEEEKEEQELLNRSYKGYIDFTVPWSLNISYNYNYSKVGFLDPNKNQSLMVSGELLLTKNWKLNASANYDFELKEIVYPRVEIYRDLGCWEMSFDWIPYGPRQQYSFSINIKNQILKDMKVTRNRNWYDR